MKSTDNVHAIEERVRARLLIEVCTLAEGFIQMQRGTGIEPTVTCWPDGDSDEPIRGWVSSTGYFIFDNGQVKRLGKPLTDFTDPELPLLSIVEGLRQEVSTAYL